MLKTRLSGVCALGVALAAGAASGQTFTAVLLDTPADVEFVEPLALNDSRVIVGRGQRTITDPSTGNQMTVFVPLMWDETGAVTELRLLTQDEEGQANDVNISGRIAGTSLVNTIIQGPGPIRIVTDDKAVFWDRPTGADDINGLVTGGAALNLKTGIGINDTGQMTGQGRPIGASTGINGYFFDTTTGVVTDIGASLEPKAINNNGAVVGKRVGTNQAFMWQDGVMTDLHAFPGIGGPNSDAFDVNDNGEAVGNGHTSSASTGPILWANGTATFLGDLGGGQGTALAINNRSEIVGRSFLALGDPAPFGRMTAFLDVPAAFHNLNDFNPPGSGWDYFSTAVDINNNGDIIGVGWWQGISFLPYLLIRQDEPCVCEVDGDAAQVDVFDLLAYLNDWFAGAAAADIDGTPGVDVFDLLAFLDCWFPASAGGCV